MPKNYCIMQIWAESGKSALPICNYSQILYQFLTFTQNLKRSRDAFANVFDNSHIETEQYYMNILSADLKPIVSDLKNAHMKDSNTASDIDYQSMVKNIIDDFASQIPTTADDDTESSNDAYINGLLLLFCKNLEMKVTQLSVEEKQTLKEIFSRSKPAKEHRKLRRRNPKL